MLEFSGVLIGYEFIIMVSWDNPERETSIKKSVKPFNTKAEILQLHVLFSVICISLKGYKTLIPIEGFEAHLVAFESAILKASYLSLHYHYTNTLLLCLL